MASAAYVASDFATSLILARVTLAWSRSEF